MALVKLVHLLSIVIWVGGMFFAYMVLRPSAASILQPPERLTLWNDVFRRLFKWVWLTSIGVVLSGLLMIHLLGGMGAVALPIHIMMLLGIVMLGIYTYVFFGQYRPFSHAVAAQDWKQAGTILATIRKLIHANLMIGLSIIFVVELGNLF